MKNKSILFFGWFFYPKTGGAETVLLNQARELVKRGYKVSVLTSILDDGEEKEENIFGINVFRRKYVNPRDPQDREIIENDLFYIINNVKPDIFHFHNGSYPSGGKDKSIGVNTIVAIFDTLKKHNIKIIEHAHNAQIKSSDETRPLRQLSWDYLICVSKFVFDEWQKLGNNAKKMKVVYNGINVELFSKSKTNTIMINFKKNNDLIIFNPARFLSMTTGEINKQKNTLLIFDALELLIKKNINNFVLVNILNKVNDKIISQKSKIFINKLIKEKKLSENIKFISTIDPDKMPEFYAGADIVCVPSLHETFGLMYLEAMAAGKIVIASNTGGPKEFIKNNINGYFVDPYNPQELSDLLSKLINDKNLRIKIGNNAQKDAKKFSIKAMVDGIEDVYKELLS
jgi:glycosyltransferase involved in cell wall biosynthesis